MPWQGVCGVTWVGLSPQKEVGSITAGHGGSGSAPASWVRGHPLSPAHPDVSPCSYDSNLNVSRDDKKNKFASTMEFVEDYLNNVVSEAVPFANEEKNKLTFEVRALLVSPAPCRVRHGLAAAAPAVSMSPTMDSPAQP